MAATKTVLGIDNPYSIGVIYNFGDDAPLIQRDPVEYKPSEGDKLHDLIEGETLDTIAYTYYKSSKYWWLIADSNNIENPLDISGFTQLLIPNLAAIKSQF